MDHQSFFDAVQSDPGGFFNGVDGKSGRVLESIVGISESDTNYIESFRMVVDVYKLAHFAQLVPDLTSLAEYEALQALQLREEFTILAKVSRREVVDEIDSDADAEPLSPRRAKNTKPEPSSPGESKRRQPPELRDGGKQMDTGAFPIDLITWLPRAVYDTVRGRLDPDDEIVREFAAIQDRDGLMSLETLLGGRSVQGDGSSLWDLASGVAGGAAGYAAAGPVGGATGAAFGFAVGGYPWRKFAFACKYALASAKRNVLKLAVFIGGSIAIQFLPESVQWTLLFSGVVTTAATGTASWAGARLVRAAGAGPNSDAATMAFNSYFLESLEKVLNTGKAEKLNGMFRTQIETLLKDNFRSSEIGPEFNRLIASKASRKKELLPYYLQVLFRSSDVNPSLASPAEVSAAISRSKHLFPTQLTDASLKAMSDRAVLSAENSGRSQLSQLANAVSARMKLGSEDEDAETFFRMLYREAKRRKVMPGFVKYFEEYSSSFMRDLSENWMYIQAGFVVAFTLLKLNLATSSVRRGLIKGYGISIEAKCDSVGSMLGRLLFADRSVSTMYRRAPMDGDLLRYKTQLIGQKGALLDMRNAFKGKQVPTLTVPLTTFDAIKPPGGVVNESELAYLKRVLKLSKLSAPYMAEAEAAYRLISSRPSVVSGADDIAWVTRTLGAAEQFKNVQWMVRTSTDREIRYSYRFGDDDDIGGSGQCGIVADLVEGVGGGGGGGGDDGGGSGGGGGGGGDPPAPDVPGMGGDDDGEGGDDNVGNGKRRRPAGSPARRRGEVQNLVNDDRGRARRSRTSASVVDDTINAFLRLRFGR